MIDRRKFIMQLAATIAAPALASELSTAHGLQHPDHSGWAPKILLRSGWQVENIGDIGHTPAMLALIEKYIPTAKVTFWPFYDYLPENEIGMLKSRFPKLIIVRGKLNDEGKSSSPELEEAFLSADLFLHNSGPATIAWKDIEVFHKQTGKPFGVYGVTFGLYGMKEIPILSKAAFLYFRDSISLKKAKVFGINAPVMDFTPDAVFAIDVTDDKTALAYMAKNKLTTGNFVCCIPKQRHTPVWLHERKGRPLDKIKQARNQQMYQHDHQPLIDAITEVVRKTKLKVLITHEDETEMQIGKDWLLDKLPEDVKLQVVWRDTPWLTDEAVSIYKRSVGFFGSEMHSPIMCIANSIPALVVRWEEQSSKGIMWQDIGLGDWLFDFDNDADVQRFVPKVLEMVQNPRASKIKAVNAKKFVDKKQMESINVVKNTIGY